jgi:hypothetical protein
MPVCLHALANSVEGSVPDDVGYAFPTSPISTGYLFPAATTRDKLLMTFGFRFQRFGKRRGRPCLVLARVTDACERVSVQFTPFFCFSSASHGCLQPD